MGRILFEAPPGERQPDDIDGMIDEIADELRVWGIGPTQPIPEQVERSLAELGLGKLAPRPDDDEAA
jgi:hypothetical protein